MYKLVCNNIKNDNITIQLFESVKIASVDYEKFLNRKDGMCQELKDYIDKGFKPDKNKYSYFVVSAMGAGEFWGANSNADYFEEEELLKSYKTFESGYVFVEHENTDPKKAIGKVVFAGYNKKMHRVELLIAIEKKKGEKYIKQFEDGKPWDVSMGTKIDYDVCSICGNKAPVAKDYCKHILKDKHKVYEDGKKVYMINKGCKFFDISIVAKGAEPNSKGLLKVASLETTEKTSEMKKDDVPGNIKNPVSDFESVLKDVYQGKGEKHEKVVVDLIKKGKVKQAFDLYSNIK